MANQYIVPRPQSFFRDVPAFGLLPETQQPLWKSLFKNVKDALFPEKLPPLRLTSRPVRGQEIWSRRSTKRAAAGSLTLHSLVIAAMIVLTIMAARSPVVEKPREDVTLIAPPLSDYQPVMQPQVVHKQELAGGGGGGERAKIIESKGHLPKIAPEQFTPPTVEIRNQKPKLANLGNPMSSRVSGPASNGPGSGGGNGSGNHGGLGSGTGPGYGPGEGGGYGGGIYK